MTYKPKYTHIITGCIIFFKLTSCKCAQKEFLRCGRFLFSCSFLLNVKKEMDFFLELAAVSWRIFSVQMCVSDPVLSVGSVCNPTTATSDYWVIDNITSNTSVTLIITLIITSSTLTPAYFCRMHAFYVKCEIKKNTKNSSNSFLSSFLLALHDFHSVLET